MLPLLYRTREPLDALGREFDRMLHRFSGSGEVPSQLAPYAVDVHEDADHFFLEAELPGFTKDEVDITLEEGVLTIRAERKEEANTKKGQPLHVERRWTQFQRAFTLRPRRTRWRPLENYSGQARGSEAAKNQYYFRNKQGAF